MRIAVELFTGAGGRLEGVVLADERPARRFEGLLELVAVLERLHPEPRPARRDPPAAPEHPSSPPRSEGASS